MHRIWICEHRSTYSTATEELHMIVISQKALSFVFESR